MNYDKVIVLGLGVKLVGWPRAVGFAKPSSIGSVVDARTLRDALKSGECHWIKLTTRQIDDHRRELENREAEGETIGKPRKRRSDAGKKRKGRSSDNIENEPPTKKTRRTTDIIQSYIYAKNITTRLYICTLGTLQPISADAPLKTHQPMVIIVLANL